MSLKILIVDPEDPGTVTRRTLLDLGHSVVSEGTLSAALGRLEAESFDACLVHERTFDEGLADHVRSMRQLQLSMPVVLLGQNTEEGRRFAWRAGADGVLADVDFAADEAVKALRRFRREREQRMTHRTAATERRVLVVDDDEQVVLPTLCEGLRRAGFSVRSATDGNAALEEIHQNEVHVLLTDVMMPGLNGPELIDATLRYAPQIAALVITGFPSLGSSVATLRAGAHDFLIKPVDTEQLVSRVEQAWNRWLLGWGRSPRRLLDRAPITVLLVEGDTADADLIRGLLEDTAERRIEVVWVRRLSEAIERLAPGGFDIVLLDLHLLVKVW